MGTDLGWPPPDLIDIVGRCGPRLHDGALLWFGLEAHLVYQGVHEPETSSPPNQRLHAIHEGLNYDHSGATPPARRCG